MAATKLSAYGPWKELTKAEAYAAPPAFVLTIVDGDTDDWAASVGFHFVNVVSYWRATKPMPPDLFVEDVWLDERGWPVEGDE